MAKVYSLAEARQKKMRRLPTLQRQKRQIAAELAKLAGVPEPTAEEFRRMKKELPSGVVADDPPYGFCTPPKLLAQYYLEQTFNELLYETSPLKLNRMRSFLERYQRFAGPTLRYFLQHYLGEHKEEMDR